MPLLALYRHDVELQRAKSSGPFHGCSGNAIHATRHSADGSAMIMDRKENAATAGRGKTLFFFLAVTRFASARMQRCRKVCRSSARDQIQMSQEAPQQKIRRRASRGGAANLIGCFNVQSGVVCRSVRTHCKMHLRPPLRASIRPEAWKLWGGSAG